MVSERLDPGELSDHSSGRLGLCRSLEHQPNARIRLFLQLFNERDGRVRPYCAQWQHGARLQSRMGRGTPKPRHHPDELDELHLLTLVERRRMELRRRESDLL